MVFTDENDVFRSIYARRDISAYDPYNPDFTATSTTPSRNVITFDIGNNFEVTIGSGTATNSVLPSYFFYNYSLSQQIYTAEEIGRGGTISSIAFFENTQDMTRYLDIYLSHVNDLHFSNNWIPVASDEPVFSGYVTFSTNDWTVIDFNPPPTGMAMHTLSMTEPTTHYTTDSSASPCKTSRT